LRSTFSARFFSSSAASQGLAQLARNAVQSITSFSLTRSVLCADGRVLFHTGVALNSIDAFALPSASCPPAVGHRHRRRHVFSAISGFRHLHHRAARQLDLPTMLRSALRAAHCDVRSWGIAASTC